MKTELKDTDPLEIEDLLLKVENSFDVKFKDGELSHVKTFGEFCDIMVVKIPLSHIEDCTTQQAFYKLKSAILIDNSINPELVFPKAKLSDLFPKHRRKHRIKELETRLGFKLSILQPPNWISHSLVILIFLSFFLIFFKPLFGSVTLVTSILLLTIATKNGIDFNLTTIREVAEKMAVENYKESRRDKKSFNKNEIGDILLKWFKHELALDELTRESEI